MESAAMKERRGAGRGGEEEGGATEGSTDLNLVHPLGCGGRSLRVLHFSVGAASLRDGGLRPRHPGVHSDEPRGGEQHMRVGSAFATA
jgi:hypothetical protein